MPTPEGLRTTPVMASPAFKDELSLLAVLFRSTFSSSAVLNWARLSASSSSSGAPERKPAAFVDACLSHFGECLTELASSYSLDGLVTLIVKKRLGGEFNLMSTFSSSAALTWARLSASSSSSGAPERKPAAFLDACLSHFGECLTELASSYSLDGLVILIVKKRLGGEYNLMSPVL
ncbi:hypothetical protein F2Q70_00042252 [Brassica cretica]|uniref:Uncharacterized protein n=1 Tax=Brassica cretica TaxID=69181 RepID=A0A8S9KNY6_BRACR|nr:hypothetical protein F2Q70_00042252 [Brassica cretica]